MTDTTFEVAQIREITREVGRFGGILRLLFVAEKTTPEGTETIAMSAEFEWQKDEKLPAEELEEVSRKLHRLVLQALLKEGWEPVGADEKGRVMALRRARTGDRTESSTPKKFTWQLTHPWRSREKTPPS